MFKQNWYEELNRQSKLSFYRTVKTEFWPENYLALAWGSRRALAKIRMSAHPLGIETGRYSSDSDMDDRRCQLCTCNDLNLLRHLPEFDPVVENEWHLLCACPYYHDFRSELPDWILWKLLQGTASVNLKILFYTSPLGDLGVFVRRALERRREFLDSRPWGPSTCLYKISRKGPFLTNLILSTCRKRCRQAKSSIFSGRWSKTQNSDQNRIYPSPWLQYSTLCKGF